MDACPNQLDLLLRQDNFVEASNMVEKALIGKEIPSTLSNVIAMEPRMLTPPIKTSNFFGGSSSQQQLAEKNLYYHLGGYSPQQQLLKKNYLYHNEDGCHFYKQPLEENFYLVLEGSPPHQHPQLQEVPLRDYIGLKYQVPYVDQQALFSFIGPNPTYLNPSGNPMDPNWDAINSFLLGQVRPGPDIIRVYKCGICSIEFPNAQAFGGHMSSHSKRKKRTSTKGELKKFNLNPSSSTNTRKAIDWPLSSESRPLKKTKNDKKKNKKVDYESDESVCNSFI